MIYAIRITVGKHMPYQDVQIYEAHETSGLPGFFEDGLVAFTCKDGTFMIPDYRVDVIHLSRAPVRPPIDARTYKRLTIDGEQPFENIYVIPESEYARYGIPIIYPRLSQFTFSCKEGVFITSDYSIVQLQIC